MGRCGPGDGPRCCACDCCACACDCCGGDCCGCDCCCCCDCCRCCQRGVVRLRSLSGAPVADVLGGGTVASGGPFLLRDAETGGSVDCRRARACCRLVMEASRRCPTSVSRGGPRGRSGEAVPRADTEPDECPLQEAEQFVEAVGATANRAFPSGSVASRQSRRPPPSAGESRITSAALAGRAEDADIKVVEIEIEKRPALIPGRCCFDGWRRVLRRRRAARCRRGMPSAAAACSAACRPHRQRRPPRLRRPADRPKRK